MKDRITTREAAVKLECSLSSALATLKTIGVPHIRCGAAYLWDADAIERLTQTLSATHPRDRSRSEKT